MKIEMVKRDGIAMTVKIRTARNLEILNRCKAGENRRQIAKDYGITISRLYQIIKMMKNK